ncbi:unnamed protein product [Allacma fusca]|uniref:Uncharacterized protein n=1 Tax=Allacma fusca TaxID=39272 RepID=A0A8J2JRL6_9HEXA|nr:unnamed protein product [Allacma fusca]
MDSFYTDTGTVNLSSCHTRAASREICNVTGAGRGIELLSSSMRWVSLVLQLQEIPDISHLCKRDNLQLLLHVCGVKIFLEFTDHVIMSMFSNYYSVQLITESS